jgi:hypothetical protein
MSLSIPLEAFLLSRVISQGLEVRAMSLIFPISLAYEHRYGAVAAEYLARGYKLSDSVLQRAIDIDGTHCLAVTVSHNLTMFSICR